MKTRTSNLPDTCKLHATEKLIPGLRKESDFHWKTHRDALAIVAIYYKCAYAKIYIRDIAFVCKKIYYLPFIFKEDNLNYSLCLVL
jgi:hypothetical protein